MNSFEAMEAVDGWRAHELGHRYDPTASLAWRRGWRWRQTTELHQV